MRLTTHSLQPLAGCSRGPIVRLPIWPAPQPRSRAAARDVRRLDSVLRCAAARLRLLWQKIGTAAAAAQPQYSTCTAVRTSRLAVMLFARPLALRARLASSVACAGAKCCLS